MLNTFATYSELYGFKRTAQEKYEKALKGPLKRKAIALDGSEFEQRGVPSHPPFRRLAGVYDTEGNWIPRVPGSPQDAVFVEIQHYSICETVSWMIGGYDKAIALKNTEKPYEVGFGNIAKKFQLMDHIGMNTKPVSGSLTLAELDWQTIIQRIWPQ
eukprot:2454788-Amphidinium_carterae.1